MYRPHEDMSWPEEFFDGFTAIPQSMTTFSSMPIDANRSFEGDIKLGRALVHNKKHSTSVWHAIANGQHYIVKMVF
jgi:hypothetical protein